jgi:SAM-dependent methyltransferase
VVAFYSRYDRIFRKFVPSVAKVSYNPVFAKIGDAVSGALALPFPELRDLPSNHLRIRIGAGNRLFNEHVMFIETGSRCWLTFLSRSYCTASSDVVELGCGCGRVARALKQDWFRGTYVGVDIDTEMLEYCRQNFPEDRFEFVLSPHRSATYSRENSNDIEDIFHKPIFGEKNSKDFVYSISLYSHLLEKQFVEYLRETHRILKPNGMVYLTFFCINDVELGGRWTFRHGHGNAYVENLRFPEAAVAYEKAFVTEVAKNIGFSEVSIISGNGQSELITRK